MVDEKIKIKIKHPKLIASKGIVHTQQIIEVFRCWSECQFFLCECQSQIDFY